ncbi:MAG: hypothetical protein QXV17_07750 [Candidatus Micrarchaeaceae archaeon]
MEKYTGEIRFFSSYSNLENKLKDFKNLISKGHIEVFGLDKIGNSNWITYYKAIDGLDLLIQKADKLNLAFFCSDAEAQTFFNY